MKFTAQQLQEMGYIQLATGDFARVGPVKAGMPSTELSLPSTILKPPRRMRQSTKPLMNKLESEWFEVLKHRWRIIVPQGMRFMLANGTWYKPDFMVLPCGLESQDTRLRAYECKGPHAFRGGKENLKIAAHQYPQIKWTLVWKENGQWKEQTVLP